VRNALGGSATKHQTNLLRITGKCKTENKSEEYPQPHARKDFDGKLLQKQKKKRKIV